MSASGNYQKVRAAAIFVIGAADFSGLPLVPFCGHPRCPVKVLRSPFFAADSAVARY